MSWDVFVQDLPAAIESVAEIPDDFWPGPIGARADLARRITEIAPDVEFSDPGWGRTERDGFSIEINLGADDPVRSFAMHIPGGDEAAEAVADILDGLGLRALDPQTPGGLFAGASARASIARWRDYRDQVIDP